MPNTDSKSTSDKEQTQSSQISPHYPTYRQQIEDDTINVYELWIILWNKKWLVIAVTIFAAIVSVVFALRQPPTYFAQALLLPPKAKDVQSWNLQGVQIRQAKTLAEVFAAFVSNLSSRRLQKKFIEKYDLMDILAPNRTAEMRDVEILQSFSGIIKKEKRENGIAVSIEWGDPKFAAKLINDYIDFFDMETIRALSADVRDSISSQIRDIEYIISSKQQIEKLRRLDQISDLEKTIYSKREMARMQRESEIENIKNAIAIEREMAKKRQEDQIKVYEEAAIIASNLGFRDRVDTINAVQNEKASSTIISSTPLYYRGFRALNAEIEFLKNRKSDDPFNTNLHNLQEKLTLLQARKSDDTFIYGLHDLIASLDLLRSRKSDETFFPGLRGLQENLATLRAIKIEDKGQHSVTIDQPAYPPKYRTKPNRKLIVSIGTVVGLFFGIFLAFFVSFIQNQKKIHSP